MLQRFSFLGSLSYEQHVQQLVTAAQGQPATALRAIVESNLAGGRIAAAATQRAADQVSGVVRATSAQQVQVAREVGAATVSAIQEGASATVSAVERGSAQTVSAIQDSTATLSEGLNTVAMTNLFGAVMTTGAIAASTVVISRRLDRVATGIDRLGVQFTEGMALIASQVDAQTDALKDIRDQLAAIHETLRSPTMTQAAEWRNVGIGRLAGALWEEARDAFGRALELDATDPVSHLMMGKLALDAVGAGAVPHDPGQAEVSFQKAARYAGAAVSRAPKLADVRSEALYLRASALLAKAALMRAGGASAEEQGARLAASLDVVDQLLDGEPQHGQGRLLRTKLLVILGREAEAIGEFQGLVRDDGAYLSAALRDDDFTRHAAAGQRVLAAGERILREAIEQEIPALFTSLQACTAWEAVIPGAVVRWLEDEGFTSIEATRERIARWSLQEIADPERPLLTLLRAASAGLQELGDSARSRWTSELSQLGAATTRAVELVDADFVDPEWWSEIAPSRGVAELRLASSSSGAPAATAAEARTRIAELERVRAGAERVGTRSQACRAAWLRARSEATSVTAKMQKAASRTGVGIATFVGLLIAGFTLTAIATNVGDSLFPSLTVPVAMALAVVTMVVAPVVGLRVAKSPASVGDLGARALLAKQLGPLKLSAGFQDHLSKAIESGSEVPPRLP